MYKKLHRLVIGWQRIYADKIPDWVRKAKKKWYFTYLRKHKGSPYNQTAFFKGNTFEYKVIFYTVGQGNIQEQYYRKYR